MMTGPLPFNTYLPALLLAILVCTGCKSTEEKTRAKEMTALRLHLEVSADAGGRSAPVPVFRQSPALVNVLNEPITSEHSVVRAWVEDVPGSFVIKIQFDQTTTWLLENVTAGNNGRRLAVFCAFPETRWLAAPLITRRIADGLLVFIPDATREEAERIVRGLNNVVAQLKKNSNI